MLIEIFLGIIAGSFLIIAIILLIAALRLFKVMDNTNDLLVDLKKKSDHLEPVFETIDWLTTGIKILKNHKEGK